ncbi:MAG TPA: SRPBCC domain-containing protein [Chloroflexota bacterium]
MSSTRITYHVDAARATVYRALLDARAIATWMVPTGMTSHVHAFDPREGGSLRISLVPNEQVVEVVEFETTDPALTGEMTMTFALSDADGGGTDILAVHDNVPSGVSAAERAEERRPPITPG